MWPNTFTWTWDESSQVNRCNIWIYFLLLLTQVDFFGTTFYFLGCRKFSHYFYFLKSRIFGMYFYFLESSKFIYFWQHCYYYYTITITIIITTLLLLSLTYGNVDVVEEKWIEHWRSVTQQTESPQPTTQKLQQTTCDLWRLRHYYNYMASARRQ